MSQDLLASLEYIEKEKGISKEVLLDALRHALISACRKGSPEKGDVFDVQIDIVRVLKDVRVRDACLKFVGARFLLGLDPLVLSGIVEIDGEQRATNDKDDPGFTIVHGSGEKVLETG